jgi:hypothetical protein
MLPATLKMEILIPRSYYGHVIEQVCIHVVGTADFNDVDEDSRTLSSFIFKTSLAYWATTKIAFQIVAKVT